MKLLIIDDELDYCTMLRMFFSRRGVDVAICHLLHQGMKSLAENDFDYVILDNNLPDGMGWDRAPEIAEEYLNTQLVLVSAYPRRYNSPLPTKANVFEKPVLLSDLLNIIGMN